MHSLHCVIFIVSDGFKLGDVLMIHQTAQLLYNKSPHQIFLLYILCVCVEISEFILGLILLVELFFLLFQLQ